MKMKFTKKIATILLSVCLIVPCFSVMALAANGVIFFSDLETSVGMNLRSQVQQLSAEM